MNDIQIQKLELLEWMASLQDKSIIEQLIKWKEKNQRISIEQYNRELDEAEAEMDRGEYISHEDFKKQMKEW